MEERIKIERTILLVRDILQAATIIPEPITEGVVLYLQSQKSRILEVDPQWKFV